MSPRSDGSRRPDGEADSKPDRESFPSPDLCATIAAALALRLASARHEPEFREEVRRYASAARSEGLRPEEAIIELKKIFASSLAATSSWARLEKNAAVEEAITWLVEAYFPGGQDEHTDRPGAPS